MSEPTTTANEDIHDSAQSQARALLARLRERAESEAPSLIDELTQLDALMSDDISAAIKKTLEDGAAFTSDMAHELRIPMTSIRGYIDMIAKGHTGPLTDMQQQFAGVIQSNVIRMEHLVSDVNDLTKIRAGRLKIEPGMEMYSNLIMAVEKETKALAKEKGHTIIFDTPKGMPFLQIDSARAKQALINLVTNALLYTPPGEGEIVVRGAKEDGDVSVTIIDNGIGMSEEELASLGEPFQRGDHDLVRQHKGHGLGFILAKSLIEMMEGTLNLESEPGTGTTVRVTLPAMDMG